VFGTYAIEKLVLHGVLDADAFVGVECEQLVEEVV
jgi:hypothetical protein